MWSAMLGLGPLRRPICPFSENSRAGEFTRLHLQLHPPAPSSSPLVCRHTAQKEESKMALSLPHTFFQIKPSLPIRKVPKAAKGNYRAQVTCRKKDIHPEFHEDAKVYCNGELVMTTGGTQKEYTVDVWSGNHPFYLGNRSAVMVEADQVEKFRQKYGELSRIMEIPVLKGEIVLPPKRKAAGKGAKKK